MANTNTYINKIVVPNGSDTITANLVDTVSGYTKNTGTVTSVGLANATNGGLSISGSPITSSGSITVGHSNVLSSAQTTQAVYPIAIDKNGHISSYGTKEDLFKVFTIDTSSYTQSQMKDVTTLGVAISSSAVSDINSAYDTLKTSIKFDFGPKVIMAYGTGERFSFTYATGVEFTNVMKFTFAGDYSNSITDLIDTQPIYAGCAYIFPECTVSAYANRMIIVYKDLSIVLTANNITSDGNITINSLDGITEFGFGHDFVSGVELFSNGIYIGQMTPDSQHYITLDSTSLNISSSDNKIYIDGLSDVKVGTSASSASSVLTGQTAILLTNTAYNSSSNKIATMSDVPTPGTSATAVGTSSSGGSASTYSKSDHVHSISDTTITNALGFTPASSTHTHGNIASGGTISSTAITPASGDYILISDNSNSGKIERGIAIGTDTTKYLRNDGTWQTVQSSGGTVTSVGLTNATNGGLSISGSPITSSGSITVGHSNVLSSAQSTQAVYPITIDKNGHIASYGSAVTISDTKVTNTLNTTTKYYLTGTSTSTTNTGTQYFDTGIYSTTTAGQLNATTYKVNEQVTLQWNSTDSSLDFIF